MPERSFGRTVRYRRTKLGLSQAKLGELVGRSTATIRSWERDTSRPNDDKVLSTLAAILGVEERQLYEKAEVDLPQVVETSPTVEQALASLRVADDTHPSTETVPAGAGHGVESLLSPSMDGDLTDQPERSRPGAHLASPQIDDGDTDGGVFADTPRPVTVAPTPPPVPVFAASHPSLATRDDSEVDSPAYVAPPEPYVQTPLTPTLADISYVEDASQRQMYRVRNLATLVAVVALIVAFVWAVGEGLGALGDWWNEFFGNLRL